MLIKRARIISILAVILMMILPFMPVAGSASALQQGVQISYHPLTGMVNFMGAPSTGRAIHAATARGKKCHGRRCRARIPGRAGRRTVLC
ncbi:MAG: hypothetical protein IPJ46_08930 [Anaerolineales bacterium]|nr:hypothetical protein [Anaerolineales bacterium]